MTTLTTIKFTRPSLNDVFLLECTFKLPLLDIHYGAIDEQYTKLGFPGYINESIDEFISWKEIISKKDELRSDLKNWLDLEENKFKIESNSQFDNDPNFGPMLNPFSLTFTKRTRFDNRENAMTYLKWTAAKDVMDYPDLLGRTKNSLEIYLDDNPISIDSL